MLQRFEIVLGGRVQGVGFRPFVFQLASRLQLTGWVRNEKGIVRLQVQGNKKALTIFRQQLIELAPVTSLPEKTNEQELPPVEENKFEILASQTQSSANNHIPPDYFLCADCLKELNDPQDRRYAYPFINCTACGPRFTIINQLPYDRANTSMAHFPLCSECEKDYFDPMNRRFHAEPLACPQCGPWLTFEDPQHQLHNDSALGACVTALQQGKIIIIKGIGGYHLCCDATNEQAIALLRERKQRPDKPLAVMFPAQGKDELDAIRSELIVDNVAEKTLLSPARPIVLLTRKADSQLPVGLAPQLHQLGVMLPYSPLHYLLLARFTKPIVATSANLSGEPVLIEANAVRQRLSHISDTCLHHNRNIVRPADDPVIRIINAKPRPFRLGRGMAPLELSLPFSLPHPVLACGGQMKNTIALAWNKRVVISPHIGELDSLRSQQVYADTLSDLERLYEVKPETLICDNHKGYFSTRWATQQALPIISVAHHHAHASIVAGEFPHEKNWLVYCWDGVGLGEDNSLWGGESFYGRPGQWQRAASWRRFRLPGGDRVAREPWRSAQSLCWQAGIDWSHASNTETTQDMRLLHEAWQKGMNSPETSSVGRLFDAAAALIGLCSTASYEGQAPMCLEQAALEQHAQIQDTTQDQQLCVELPLIEDGELLRTDWQPLLPLLLNKECSVTERAYAFHLTLARALLAQAIKLKERHGDFAIGLSGGVFQNRLLCELIMQQCNEKGFRVYLPQQVPVNDAGLSYGQVIEALARMNAE